MLLLLLLMLKLILLLLMLLLIELMMRVRINVRHLVLRIIPKMRRQILIPMSRRIIFKSAAQGNRFFQSRHGKTVGATPIR